MFSSEKLKSQLEGHQVDNCNLVESSSLDNRKPHELMKRNSTESSKALRKSESESKNEQKHRHDKMLNLG